MGAVLVQADMPKRAGRDQVKTKADLPGLATYASTALMSELPHVPLLRVDVVGVTKKRSSTAANLTLFRT